MASTFTRKTDRNLGTTATAVATYTPVSGKVATVIGLSLANIDSGNNLLVDVWHYDSNAAANTYLLKDAPIPIGSSLVPVGGDQKIVLANGDYIVIQSNFNTSIDAFMSVLELDQA